VPREGVSKSPLTRLNYQYQTYGYFAKCNACTPVEAVSINSVYGCYQPSRAEQTSPAGGDSGQETADQ
jgi:hypothetical protein